MLPDRVIRITGGDARVEPELWSYAGLPSESAPSPLGEGWGEGPIVVPLATWNEKRTELAARAKPIGVWLKPDDDPAALAQRLGDVPGRDGRQIVVLVVDRVDQAS